MSDVLEGLVEWLEKTWDEDEARLTYPAFCGGPWPTTKELLARLAAERMILEDYREVHARYLDNPTPFGEGRRFAAIMALTRVAEGYAERPGYREEWKS